MNPVDLQDLVDRELKRLPTPRAPHTLLTRVLAQTVHRPALPWYRQPWTTWPRAWQAASVLALVAIVVGAWYALPALSGGGQAPSWRSVAAVPDRVVSAGRTASEVATVVRVFWRVLIEPVAVYLFAMVLSLSLACALIWMALERLALGGASQQ